MKWIPSKLVSKEQISKANGSFCHFLNCSNGKTLRQTKYFLTPQMGSQSGKSCFDADDGTPGLLRRGNA